MPEAYIVDAVRSPVGRRGGGLSGIHPADLGAHAIRTIVERGSFDPAAIEDVILGWGAIRCLGPVERLRGLGGPLRQPGDLTVHLCRADRPGLRPVPRGHGE